MDTPPLNRPPPFIGRSFLSCTISTAVIAVVVAADAAAASTTNEALYSLAAPSDTSPRGGSLGSGEGVSRIPIGSSAAAAVQS